MSCQYDSNFAPNTSVINTNKVIFNRPKLSTFWNCKSYVSAYLNKESGAVVPNGCNMSDPTSCFCPPKYKLNFDGNNINQDKCKNTNLSVVNVADIYYENGCIGNNPQTSSEDALDCCTGVTNQNTPGTKCGIGYCPGGPGCITKMYNYCNNKDLTKDQFNNCVKYLDLATHPVSEYGNYEGSRIIAKTMLNNYYPDPLNTPLYKNPNNDKALTVCKNAVAGACSPILTKLCSRFTDRSQLNCDVNDKECQKVLELCGCHLNPNLYFDKGKSETIPTECDSLCIVPGVIKKSKLVGDRWKDVNCSKNICVIDYSNYSDWSSASLNVNQECGTPKGGKNPYNCFMDINILGKDTSILNQNINQKCANCFTYDSKNLFKKPVSIPCAKGTPTNTFLSIYV